MALAMVMGGVSPMTAAAQAEVTHVSEQGFAVLHLTKINAAPEKVWATLLAPQSFWSGSHSWSGDAANMYLDPQAGGCFCEKIPTKTGDGGSLNSVEHMRVIYSERPRVLRMSGALGPLQSEGVIGTMNIAMEADGTGTKISLSYVVGGFMRLKPADIAPAVDAVLGEQLLRLKARAEGRDPAAVVWPPKKAEAANPAEKPMPAAPDAAANAATPTDGAPKGAPPAKEEPKSATPNPTPVAAPKADAAAKPASPSATDTPKPTPSPAPAAPTAKAPLSERLKAGDSPSAPPSSTPPKPSGGAAAPAPAPAAAPSAVEKKKPIVEDAPKAKTPPVPPGTR